MVEQLAGAGIGAVVVLGYVLLVECLTVAVILLAEFIIGPGSRLAVPGRHQEAGS